MRNLKKVRGILQYWTGWRSDPRLESLSPRGLRYPTASPRPGVTGQAIRSAILTGERDPQKLAALKDHRIKASRDVIAKSLRGG